MKKFIFEVIIHQGGETMVRYGARDKQGNMRLVVHEQQATRFKEMDETIQQALYGYCAKELGQVFHSGDTFSINTKEV